MENEEKPDLYELRMPNSQTCFLRQLLEAVSTKEGEKICETDNMKQWVSKKSLENSVSDWIPGGPTRDRFQMKKRRDWRVSE